MSDKKYLVFAESNLSNSLFTAFNVYKTLRDGNFMSEEDVLRRISKEEQTFRIFELIERKITTQKEIK